MSRFLSEDPKLLSSSCPLSILHEFGVNGTEEGKTEKGREGPALPALSLNNPLHLGQTYFLFLLISFWNRTLLCSPCWPQTHYIAKDSTDLLAILRSQLPKYWDYMSESSSQAVVWLNETDIPKCGWFSPLKTLTAWLTFFVFWHSFSKEILKGEKKEFPATKMTLIFRKSRTKIMFWLLPRRLPYVVYLNAFWLKHDTIFGQAFTGKDNSKNILVSEPKIL